MTQFHRWPLALAMAGTLLSVGCSSEQPTDADPSPEGSASPDSSTASETDSRVLGAGTQALAAGTYEVDLGEERLPNIEITVPDGWTSDDGWVVRNGVVNTPHWVAVQFWDVDEVYAHPCHWRDGLIQPGPTVADLATALADQPLRDATEPVDIVVDGFEGVQMELSVPADMPARRYELGDDVYADFLGCDRDEVVGDRAFKSWTGVPGSWGGSERYQQGPGQVDRLWILDLDGERLVIDATYLPSTDAQDRGDLWQVMESIRFET
jgi:hypothetical protein